MKTKPINLKMVACLMAMAIVLTMDCGVASALHQGIQCTVCHDMHGGDTSACDPDCYFCCLNLPGCEEDCCLVCDSATCDNDDPCYESNCYDCVRLCEDDCYYYDSDVDCKQNRLVSYWISMPDPPYGTYCRRVRFLRYTGDKSYADGDDVYDGVCEVCHTSTAYHTNTGDGTTHYDGEDCIRCHSHSNDFYHGGVPDAACMDPDCHGYPSHATHFDTTGKGPGIPLSTDGCYVCHAEPDPDFDPSLFKDGEPLATTMVCDECHSNEGAFPGGDPDTSLLDANIGAKANWPDDFTVSPEGIYEADGVTLKPGKKEWCTTCHDDIPASSRPGPGAEVVVDNSDPDPAFALVCTWGTSSSGGYNGDYCWHAAGDGSCTATWTPNLPAADTYNVRAWWKASSNRATNAKYTIHYDGGSETVEVNQKINGNQWNLLGSYPFAAGTSGYVVLSDDANENEYVIADAVKFDNGSLEVSINAPTISGDNSTYGFYINGHKINCLSCHDASKKHIDHEHRTYDVNDATGVAINPYADSYRLKASTTKPSREFCFTCHNGTEVLGQNEFDVSHTNFWNDDTNDQNSHYLHAVAFTGIHFDSDWDGVIDSTESCIACHNVHGSLPTDATVMIRHGELISTYGTTDKVPALNFTYLGSSTLVGSTGGRMNLAGGSFALNRVCWACHGAISYDRTPYLGPKVIMGQADPEEVANDGSGTSTITVFVSDPDDNVSSVTIDLTPIGGVVSMVYNSLTGIATYDLNIPASTPDVPLTFEITAADGDSNTGKGEVTVLVVDPASIYVDNADATFVSDWGVSATGGYRRDYRWHAGEGDGSCTATWTPHVLSTETYNVYAWWKASSNRATNAKYTIYHASGSQTVEVNQEIGDSQWNYLGNFSFAEGTSGYVVLSDDANEYVIADAIKLTPSPPPPPETVIVDNPNAQFVCYWGTSATGGYNDDYRWHAGGTTGSCTATWTPNLVAGASYSVYAWWKASSNRATDAPYTIYYDGGSATVDVNQQIDGDQWNLLGTYPFVAGQSGYVVLSDYANQYVIADAVKFEP